MKNKQNQKNKNCGKNCGNKDCNKSGEEQNRSNKE